MNAEIWAKWLNNQGYRVLRTQSSYWVDLSSGVLQAFPYHWLIKPGDQELTQLLKNNFAIGLRYSTPFQHSQGVASYHVIYEGDNYKIENLPKKARHDVKKGLDTMTVAPISLEQLGTEGWTLRVETLERQGRIGAEKQVWWQTMCRTAEGLEGIESWGVSAGDRLVACLLAIRCDNCYSILYQQSATDFLPMGVNNALTYTATNYALNLPGAYSVFYGLHSLDAPSSVDNFKFRMNYQAKPVRQRVVFHPWLSPLINHTSYAIVKKLGERQSSSHKLSKLEGLMRFYLDGSLPLTRQQWPDCLEEQRVNLLTPY